MLLQVSLILPLLYLLPGFLVFNPPSLCRIGAEHFGCEPEAGALVVIGLDALNAHTRSRKAHPSDLQIIFPLPFCGCCVARISRGSIRESSVCSLHKQLTLTLGIKDHRVQAQHTVTDERVSPLHLDLQSRLFHQAEVTNAGILG